MFAEEYRTVATQTHQVVPGWSRRTHEQTLIVVITSNLTAPQ